ncbi:lysine-sensitive aspartokinase 3 [Spirochaeta africana]|uniref:Aspartokinase n=1 Tax=Spirochaeta africana (strain ATCC 700263 / DSM 8902 / Z-7692) TaxID=889378 RepID=H9UGQ2_SPIAZ|nr:lysine-sensitive aspartokinase 3 [Spirochaeta africana]AFG36695.1 aspartate kinase [Spirochaeta africana DSM 8902]
MRVIKFGGTSVQDAPRIRTVLDIAVSAARSPGGAVLVSSALAGTTNSLLHIADLGRAQQRDAATAEIAALRERHLDEAAGLLGHDSPQLPELQQHIESLISQIRSLLEGILLLRECSARTRDAIVSCGELLSTTIIAAAAASLEIPSEWIDARELLCTDDNFGEASVDFPASNQRIQARIQPRMDYLYITQGFIAANERRVTTTLGRGGSDYSAAIIAAALGAEALEIWTDVDGIMTTDPRIVSSARRVPAMSYAEAAELAYFGAKVVHPSTVQPAIGVGIPIYVRNTHNPHNPGTVISNERHRRGLRAIAAKKEITVVTTQSSRMLHAYGFMQQLFGIFARNRVAVDLVATSEVSVSVTLDPGVAEDSFPSALEELKELGEVTVERSMAIICLVGHDLWKDAVFIARVFTVMQDIPVRLISLGSSDINLSLVVPEEYRETAVVRLHQAFFPEQDHG